MTEHFEAALHVAMGVTGPERYFDEFDRAYAVLREEMGGRRETRRRFGGIRRTNSTWSTRSCRPGLT